MTGRLYFTIMGIAIAFMFGFVVAMGINMDKNAKSADAVVQEQSVTLAKTKPPLEFPQLKDSGRGDAATMQLIGSPPMQPASHIDRWNPEQHEKSCLMCHASPQTGAPTPPGNHWYDQKVGGKIFRDNCIQCHAQQNDTKPAFNREN